MNIKSQYKNITISKEKKIVFLLCILLLIIYSLFANQIYFPYIVDSFGYWSGGAYISGRNWSAMMEHVPYYSYGYGIILAPFFILSKTPILMYRCSLILNSFIMVGCFLLCINILKNLYKNVNVKYIIASSFAASVYTSYITLSRTGLSECLLVLLVLIQVRLLIQIMNKPSYISIIILEFLNLYSYMVHQRMLAIIVATMLLLILLVITKKLEKKYIFAYFFMLIMLFALAIMIKGGFKAQLWKNVTSAVTDVNDYSVQLHKIKNLVQTATIKTVIKQLIGQLFYVGASTFFVGYIAVWFFLKDTFLFVKYYAFRRKTETVANNDSIIFVSIYSLLIFIGLTAISVIYYSGGIIRIDQTVYGRYMEPSFILLLLFGFMFLSQRVNTMKIYVLFIPFLAIFGFLTNQRVSSMESNTYSIGSAAGIAYYYTKLNFGMLKITVAISVLFLGMLIMLYKYKARAAYFITIIISVAFIFMGEVGIKEYEVDRQKVLSDDLNVVETIKKDYNETPIYFLDSLNTASTHYVDFIQFMFPNKVINLINVEDLSADKTEKLLLLPQKQVDKYQDLLYNHYNKIYSSNSYALYLYQGD